MKISIATIQNIKKIIKSTLLVINLILFRRPSFYTDYTINLTLPNEADKQLIIPQHEVLTKPI